jgi:hypothetical protein
MTNGSIEDFDFHELLTCRQFVNILRSKNHISKLKWRMLNASLCELIAKAEKRMIEEVSNDGRDDDSGTSEAI